MDRLITSGHAYAPGDGDVYFDVRRSLTTAG